MAKAWSDPTITIVTDADGSAYLMMLNENSSPNSELITLDNLKLSLYPGITDDATGERLKISDTDIIYGANAVYSITHKYDTRALYLSGGISASDGGNLLLLGGANATQPGDVYIRSGANTFLAWDESAKAGAINTTSSDGSDSGSWTISGGGDEIVTRGAVLQLFGNENSNTGDVRIYSGGAAGSEVYINAYSTTSSIKFLTNLNTLAMIIDSSQNIGVGVTPKDWDPTFDAIQIGGTASFNATSLVCNISENCFYDDVHNRWEYMTTSYASKIYQAGGQIFLQVAAYGTAGNLVTFISGIEVALEGSTDVIVSLPKGQLQFPATQNASSDVNTLDDYEEGTWTPIVGGLTSETGQSYTINSGSYTKIGNRVFCNGYIVMSAKGTIVGDLLIKGLPFTAYNSDDNYSPVHFSYLAGFTLTAERNLCAYTQITTTMCIFRQQSTVAGEGSALISTSNISNGVKMMFSFNYRTE